MFDRKSLNETFLKFLEEWEDKKDYIIGHTSGSTGIPKEIKLLKEDMIASAKATNQFFGIKEDSLLYCPLSVDYIAGKMMCVRALTANCKLAGQTPSNTLLFPEIPLSAPIDLIAIVPSQTQSLLEAIVEGRTFKNVIIGGAPLNAEKEKALEETDVNVYVTFGMTETCSHVALRRVGEEVYNALPDISFSVDNESRLIIASNVRNFGILNTNDIVELISPTRFKWKGRWDNVINSGGIKIFPEEIEHRLSEVLPVVFAIGAEKDDKWGERVVICVEDKDGLYNDDMLNDMMRIYLPSAAFPKKIYRVDRIPKSGNGKVSRAELNKLIASFSFSIDK